MSNRLGPMEVTCDAPPYPVVQACSQIGIETPEDVRWCRRGPNSDGAPRWQNFMHFPPFNVFFTEGEAEPQPCSCGHMLPALEKYVFAFASGEELAYYLGQCSRCHTVFWEEA